ncbi:hypothetical protein MHYP_G00004840 [Metynnis hypsauchen]
MPTPGGTASPSQPQQERRSQPNAQPNFSHTNLSPLQPSQYYDNISRRNQPIQNIQPRSSNVSDLAIYLARRDLVTAGLKTFDNQPANYLSWKSSFLNATEGLDLKPNDSNKLALSIEDEDFLRIMNKEFVKDETNSWVAPLPFRVPRKRLPNNREQALTRLMSLRRTLLKKKEMKDHFVAFMEKIFINGHAKSAPPLESNKECWYLPSFGVYHPKNPGQIRIVFDSSAKYGGISLNDVLLRGPDLNNSLLGVLIRFRKEPVAVMADIEQMYYSFLVREDHRDFLRFLWFHNHDLDSDVVEYRMKFYTASSKKLKGTTCLGLFLEECLPVCIAVYANA